MNKLKLLGLGTAGVYWTGTTALAIWELIESRKEGDRVDPVRGLVAAATFPIGLPITLVEDAYYWLADNVGDMLALMGAIVEDRAEPEHRPSRSQRQPNMGTFRPVIVAL